MGNICCDSAERTKASAFSPFNGPSASDSKDDSKHIPSMPSHSSALSGAASDHQTNTASSLLKLQQAQVEAELERKRREEQKRLDQIVSSTGRDMVALYGRDGSSPSSFRLKSQGQLWSGNIPYYDSTYTSSVARDLFRDDGSSAGIPLFIKEIDLRLERDQRRKQLIDILVEKLDVLPPDEAVASDVQIDRKMDWRETLRDIVPSVTIGWDETLADDSTENSLEREVLFPGLQPLVENLP